MFLEKFFSSRFPVPNKIEFCERYIKFYLVSEFLKIFIVWFDGIL